MQTQSNSEQSSGLANERLRKAIERNRKKMAKREFKQEAKAETEKKSFFADRLKRWEEQRTKLPAKFSAPRKSLPTNPNKIEIIDPPKRRKKVSSSSKVKRYKAKKAKESKWSKFAYRGGWLFCLYLLVQLIISEKGIYDYFVFQNKIKKKQIRNEQLTKERRVLKEYLAEIRSNPRFQKKIARDQLGVIEKDEYLIVFASDSEWKSK